MDPGLARLMMDANLTNEMKTKKYFFETHCINNKIGN